MRLGMSTRLFLAILATSALAVVLVGVATRLNFERGFLGYLNDLATERMAMAQPRLERAYLEHGNWDFLRGDRRAWHTLLRPTPEDELRAQSGNSSIITSDLTGAILRMSLLDRQGQWVAGFASTGKDVRQMPLRANGETVGWLTMVPFQSVADGGDQRFQEGQAKTTIAIAILALGLSALIAWWVARTLLAPVRRVAAATHRLAAGHHDIRVPVDSQDEVGQLARDFNHLALTLGRNENLRRNFMADVSHELRTPLGILKGELEALEDGIVPLNAEAVASLAGRGGAHRRAGRRPARTGLVRCRRPELPPGAAGPGALAAARRPGPPGPPASRRPDAALVPDPAQGHGVWRCRAPATAAGQPAGKLPALHRCARAP